MVATMMQERSPRSTEIAKPMVTVNVAFMQEIKEGSEELWQLLRDVDHLALHPLSIRLHPHRTVDLLVQLQDQLGLYFSLEEYYGYFEGAASVDLQVSERACALRFEHQAMYLDICAIVDRAERLFDERRWASLTRHIATRGSAFCEQLKTHEKNEQRLLLDLATEKRDEGNDLGSG